MSTTMATEERAGTPKDPLADPALHRALADFVRRRVSAPDVDDVVQTVLCDALGAEGRPADPEEVRRWVIGIARHKVADHHRRRSREDVTEIPELSGPPPPVEERELARWAERQVDGARDGQQTLSWMAREGEGEKLESIAAEEQVPAARVRQRVSRMRRWMKERWLAELAAVAALCVLAILVARALRKEPDEVAPRPDLPPALPEPPSPLDRARALRAEAYEACDRAAWQECLRALDEAASLDPAGDRAPEVAAARDRARDALTPPPIAPTAPTAPPTDATAPSPTAPSPTVPQPPTRPSPKSNVAPKPAPVSTAAPPSPKSGPFEKKAPPRSKGGSLDSDGFDMKK